MARAGLIYPTFLRRGWDSNPHKSLSCTGPGLFQGRSAYFKTTPKLYLFFLLNLVKLFQTHASRVRQTVDYVVRSNKVKTFLNRILLKKSPPKNENEAH